MEMGDGFASHATVVDHKTKPFFRAVEAQIGGDLTSDEKEVSENGLIFIFRFPHSRNRLLGNDKNVGWCLRIDVAKSEAVVILEDDISGYFPGDDLLEKSHEAINI